MTCFMKDVHDVRKVCLETTLCVIACFDEFYVLVLDEIDVICIKSYASIFEFKTSRQTSPRTNQGSLRKDPS